MASAVQPVVEDPGEDHVVSSLPRVECSRGTVSIVHSEIMRMDTVAVAREKEAGGMLMGGNQRKKTASQAKKSDKNQFSKKKAAGLCALRQLVKEHAPDVLCLAEPMVQVCKFPVIFFSRLGYAMDFIHNIRDEKVPNLWIIWKLGVSRPVVAGMSDQHISVIFDWPGSKVGISFVHASSFKIMRRQLWLDLELSISALVPWSVMGDFNATLLSHEKRGPGKFNLRSAAEFQAMVDACELLSIPSQGKKFTWTNNRRRGHVVAVLDRSFCNGKWIDVFRNVKQRVLLSSVSDHAPLIVVSDDVQRPTNIPFRFHSFWMENDQFISVVEEAWKTPIGGNPIFVLAQKLKQVKENLKVWARATFPNLNDEVDKAKLELKKVQDMIEVAGMTDELFNREADAKTVLLKANQMYEKLWDEKAKLRWMKNGDCNSKIFHLSVKLRRLKNQITSLKNEDGTCLSDQQGILSYVSDFFEKFHEADAITVHNDLLDNIPRVLEEEDVAGLEIVPSGDEIKQAVWDLDPVSSPGPDGFPGVAKAIVFDVTKYGAKANGKMDISKAVSSAWSASCASAVPSTVLMSKGTYLLGPVVLSGCCKSSSIGFQVEGIVQAPSSLAAFNEDWIVFKFSFSIVDRLNCSTMVNLPNNGL
ncbi:uncharacterized protein LOC122084931 [Macadamia integrifolia]|uniref:uncharacterized protein LOC122084931 n=1 Tax=Macadamia integrifolia TaxID=60698 RepID=UPI001C4EBDC4|nr:uncharacterized protein LOC122084931 [Macadamia integrifolia]